MILTVESDTCSCRRGEQDGWSFSQELQLWVCRLCRKPSKLVLESVAYGWTPYGP